MVRKRKPQKGKVTEDPHLLDARSPFDWIQFELPFRYEAVRKQRNVDPWSRPSFASENDALTERRRRKLQEHTLSSEDDNDDVLGDSVA